MKRDKVEITEMEGINTITIAEDIVTATPTAWGYRLSIDVSEKELEAIRALRLGQYMTIRVEGIEEDGSINC